MPRPQQIDYFVSAGTTWLYVVKFPEGVDFTDGASLEVIIDKDWSTPLADAEIGFSSADETASTTINPEHVNWVYIHHNIALEAYTKVRRYIRIDYISAPGSRHAIIRGTFEIGP